MAALLKSQDPPADIQVSVKEIKIQAFFWGGGIAWFLMMGLIGSP
jgi:hypothetical protein